MIWIALSFLGCAPQGQENVLTIWESYNDQEHELFMQIVREFSKKTGIEVHVQRIPFFGIETKVLTAIATRSTPDVARLDLASVAKLASRGALEELSQYDEIKKIVPEILPSALISNRLGDKLYGVPDQINCLALFYNKKLFEELKLSPPDTWEEFIEVAKKLTDREKGIYGFAMRNTLWWTLPFIYAFGGDILDENGHCALASPEVIKALEFKRDLYAKYRVEPGAWKAGAVDPDVGFENGKYAMVFNGPWKIKQLLEAGIPFDVAPIPKGKYGRPTPIGGTDMVVFKQAKHKKAAVKFLSYLLSKDVQTLWANELGQIPVNVKSLPEVDTQRHPYLSVFLELIKEAKPRPFIPDYQAVENIVNPEMEAVLTGKKSAEQAMKDACERIEKEVLSSSSSSSPRTP